MNIAITGHRPNKLDNDYDLTSDLIKKIRLEILKILGDYYKVDEPDTWVTLITGMALGIDTLFALIAIENNIPFIAAIPCWNQDSKWPKKSQELYGNILANKLCTIYQVGAKPYDKYCMQKRNIWMVDNCDILIAVWDGTSGGTANCIKYAQSIGKTIIYINPKDLI